MADLSLPSPLPPFAAKNPQLWAKAQELEAGFLSEMLGHAGVGAQSESFSGGIGEEQFASFLRGEQAKAIVAQGGIGLAESLFRAMSEVQDDATK